MQEILDILNNIRPEVNFTTSDNFVEDGFLDSLDVVTLVSELDNKFSISIDGVDIVPENFKNLEAIINLLRAKGVDL
jgi:acyl carrier protein